MAYLTNIFPIKWTDHSIHFQTKEDLKKKTKHTVPVHYTIDKIEENGCLSCEVWFKAPTILTSTLSPFKLTLTQSMQAKIKASLKAPHRIDDKHFIRFTCDRLGKDYWPIQDDYQRILNLDPGLYRDVEYVKEEARKLVALLQEKVEEKIYFIEL